MGQVQSGAIDEKGMKDLFYAYDADASGAIDDSELANLLDELLRIRPSKACIRDLITVRHDSGAGVWPRERLSCGRPRRLPRPRGGPSAVHECARRAVAVVL